MQELKLQKGIYTLDAVKQAIEAFAGLAKIDVKEENHKIIIKMENIDKDYQDIIYDEFANYVLGVMG